MIVEAPSGQKASGRFIKSVEALFECSLHIQWITDKVCMIEQPALSFIILFYLPYSERIYTENPNDKAIIHVDEDVWLRKPEALLDRIATIAGKGTRIYARKTIVARVDKGTAIAFQNEHHLQVALPGKYRYGLFKDGELLSLAVFSGLRRMRYAGYYRSIELLRFCHRDRYIVIGGLSKIFAKVVGDFSPNDIMTYLDKDWTSGEKFEKLGFERKENTRPQLFAVHKASAERFAVRDRESDILVNDEYYLLLNSGSIKMIKRIVS